MHVKKLFINASNCHQGGGKTLLDSFISGISDNDINYYFFIDKRYKIPEIYHRNIIFHKVNLYERLFITKRIKKLCVKDDIILYFGNLPPITKYNFNKVVLLLSNRFYVDKISFKGFSVKDIVKISLEKIYFNLTKKNVNEIVVQTRTMKNLLAKSLPNMPIKILPFENSSLTKSQNFTKDPFTFIYVASLIPYKNHQILLQAWLNLKVEGESPRLYLTIDQNNSLKKWIKSFISKHSLNIVLLENLNRNELLNIYKKCEYLIYPSTFEAYGLPLIEASNYGLKILAADLDYCWDLITPYDFFNPYDSTSVSRCVLRSIASKSIKSHIFTPKDFISKLIQL